MTMTATKAASGKSLQFLANLVEQKDVSNHSLMGVLSVDWKEELDAFIMVLVEAKAEDVDADQINDWLDLNDRVQFDQKSVSHLIDALKRLPYKERKENGAQNLATEPGIYKVGDAIFKVQKNRAGSHLYAKKLIVGDGGEVWFDYAGSLVKNRITAESKLSYEEAKQFGALYGTCVCCGRLLTDELSIALGIGPICGGRQFGERFKFHLIDAKLAIGKKLTKGERELIERISADG